MPQRRKPATRTDAALANCNMAVKLAISSGARAEVLNNRSVLHYARGEYDAALADNTAALKINDRMAEAIVNRGSIFLVRAPRPGGGGEFRPRFVVQPGSSGEGLFQPGAGA